MSLNLFVPRFPGSFVRRNYSRAVSILVLLSLLVVSMPAAPQTIVATAGATWQDTRFAFLSSGIVEKMPNRLASFLKLGRRSLARRRYRR